MLHTPIGFATHVLGLELYPWQDEVLTWYEDPRRRTKGALATPNGAGKSSGVVAALALWWAAVHRRGKVVITTKDRRQLTAQLLPALQRHRAKFGGWEWKTSPGLEIVTPTGGTVRGFTTDDPGRAEGWHKEDDREGPLLMIVDEAKSVEEPIFQALDRCTFNGLLYVSSPGVMAGTFYHAFTRDAAQFRRRQVGLAECPHIPPEKVADIVAKYGAEHPFTQSAVHGRFMAEDDATAWVFPLTLVTTTLAAPPPPRPGERRAFCDFAAGGDENVLAVLDGNTVLPLVHWRERNTMAAVGRFLAEFRRAELEPGSIWGDETGLGRPMCDALAEAGWPLHRVNNGAPALRADAYTHRGAEQWWEAAARLRRGKVRLPPGDDTLVAQLTSRRATRDSRGRLGVEPKDSLRARGVTSPDRADAVCGVLAAAGPVGVEGVFGEEWPEEAGAGLAGMVAG